MGDKLDDGASALFGGGLRSLRARPKVGLRSRPRCQTTLFVLKKKPLYGIVWFRFYWETYLIWILRGKLKLGLDIMIMVCVLNLLLRALQRYHRMRGWWSCLPVQLVFILFETNNTRSYRRRRCSKDLRYAIDVGDLDEASLQAKKAQ